MSRPELLVVATGTGTEVGKTWVACRLAETLRVTGARVAARKPAQSFDPGDGAPTDAELLAAATGDAADQVCPPPRWYPVPMAPPMAAAVLGSPGFSIGDLVGEVRWPAGVDVGLVEGAGGVRSPLADDGDTADLARRLGADLAVLVADAGLGTINAVRLAVAALDVGTVVFLNRFDPADDLHRRNRDWLAERDGLDLCTDVASLAKLLRR